MKFVLIVLIFVSFLLLGCTETTVECPKLPETYVKECITWSEPTWEQVSRQRNAMDLAFRRELDEWNEYGERCVKFAKAESWEEYQVCRDGDYSLKHEFYSELGCIVTYVDEFNTQVDCAGVYKGSCLRYEYVRDGVGE